MAILGLRTTENFVADGRPLNWRAGILMTYPNGKAPLTGLTAAMKDRTTDDPEFNWWEKAMQTRRLALGANMTLAGTTLTVTSGALGLKEGDILRVEQTDELMRVSADPSSDTSISVVRGVSGSTAATVTYNGSGINPNLVVIGSAYEEGSSAPTGVQFDPTKKYNYTQIFRNTLEFTRTAAKTRLRTGDQVKEAKRECLEIHSVDMERAFIFGKRHEGTLNGKPWRTTGGIISFIDSGNIKTVTSDYGSGLTLAGLETYMYNIFKFGSSEKMCFLGNRAMLTIQQVIRLSTGASWNMTPGIKEYGMNVSRLTSPFGDLVLKTHPLFNQMEGGTTGTAAYYGMESWALILDMAEITYVPFTDSDTKYQAKLEENGVDGMKSGYLTECGLEVHHPKHHYLLKNLVAAAAG